MTNSLQTDPRRALRETFRRSGRPPLEMPVLFQLADLSVQKLKVAPLPSAPLAETVFIPELPIAAVPVQAPQAELARQEAPKFEPLRPEPSVAEEPQVEATKIEIALTGAETEIKAEIKIVQDSDSPISAPAAEVIVSVPANSNSAATEIAPPKDAAAPTLRDRAELRTKSRRSAPSKSDWMQTHGKVIAVGFVIALIATIYMAQNGDEPSPANPAAATSAAAEATGDAGESENEAAQAHVAKESVPLNEQARPVGLANETSPAASDATEAHAELHAPLVVKEPTDGGEVADAKSLFPWKDAGETRVAAKPDDGRTKPENPKPKQPESPALTEPAPAEAPHEEAPSLYGPPSSLNREEPASEGPQLNAPVAYPVTNESSFRIVEPARPNVAQPRATPASFDHAPQPRTSGPRHERTGSGLY